MGKELENGGIKMTDKSLAVFESKKIRWWF
jgi:hypothetical protein